MSIRPAAALLPATATLLIALAAGAATAAPEWEDVAGSIGIDFIHAGDGASTQSIATTGGGACFADFDGDGYEDLYLTNTLYNDTTLQEKFRPTSRVYRNLGDGTFEDVTSGSGGAHSGHAQGCAAADYDGDGDLDLYVSAFGEGTLYRNDGPFRFANVTLAAGVSTERKCDEPDEDWGCFGTGPSWVDVNDDGCLDLYLATYGKWKLGFPASSQDGQANIYFENDCDGTFTDRTEERNLDEDPGPDHSRSFQPMWADYDGDGDLDVYITCDGCPNGLLRRNGDGTFTDVAAEAGVDDPRAGMGLEFDDVDGDAWPDLYMTHYAAENNGFYVNDRDGTFTDRSGEGELDADFPFVGWGTAFFDYDHDGDKDIYAVNGHAFLNVRRPQQERLVFRNDGDLVFRHVTNESGTGMTMISTARGSAWADYDFDGDLDVAVNNVNNESANFLRARGVDGGWLQVQLRQGTGDWQAVGARVTVRPEGEPASTRLVQLGASYLSQNSAYLHFGVGTSPLNAVDVVWPDGETETWSDVPSNSVVRLTRGVPRIESDTLAPRTTLALDGPTRNGWHRGIPTATLTATDLGVTMPSGVDRTEYRIDGGPWTTYGEPFPVPEGVRELEFRSFDLAGNAEPVRSQVVRVDDTPPATRIEITGEPVDGWHLSAPLVTLVASDAGSGVELVELRRDGGHPWETYADPIVHDLEGERAFGYRSRDVAGHVEEARVETIRVDLTPPVTVATFQGPVLAREGGFDVTAETYLLLAAADAGRGVDHVEHRLDGGSWTRYRNAITFLGEDREIALEHRATDLAGRVEEARDVRLFLDNHRPPPVTILSPLPGRAHAGGLVLDLAPTGRQETLAAGDVDVRAVAGPDVSGVAWTRVLVDGIERARAAGGALAWTWPTLLEAPGAHVLRVEAADGKGNVGAREIPVIVLGVGAKA